MTLLQTIRGWQNFYMLTGAAAATLIGLHLIDIAIGFFNDAQLAAPGLAIVDLLCLTFGLRNTRVLTLWLILHQARNNNAATKKATDDAGSESLIR